MSRAESDFAGAADLVADAGGGAGGGPLAPLGGAWCGMAWLVAELMLVMACFSVARTEGGIFAAWGA